MKKERNLTAEKERRSSGPFLQPLALAVVCFVFVGLLLTLAAMDFRTLDKTLMGYMEMRGADFIRTVQQAAVFNLQQMNSSQELDFAGAAAPDLEDQRLSLHESMVMAMLQLAQRIDHEAGNGPHGHASLAATLAMRRDLWNLALFDNQGGLTFQKQPVSHTVQEAIRTMVEDHEDLTVRVFEPLKGGISLRFVALRRKDHKGFVVLIFDHDAFLLWELRIALETAVEAVGMPSNTDCFLIGDGGGVNLFQSGACSGLSSDGLPVSSALEQQKTLSGGRVIWNGRKQLTVIEGFSVGEGNPLIAHLGLNTDNLDRMIGKEKRWGIIAMGLMVFMAVISMWFLYRNQNRHIARMQEMERRLHQAERLSAMGRLASGVAHEIRNPLNAISMACQRLKQDNLQQLSTVIRNEIGRLDGIVEEFLGLSRGRQLKLERSDLADLIRQVGLLMGEESHSRGIEIRMIGIESSLMVLMDGNKIKQALINIVKNAMESIEGSGTVTIKATSNKKEMAVISISDTGTGLVEGDGDKIFNLDFTTKEKGLGLGLALAHEIIQAHGGEIRFRSAPGVGTTFLIMLPVKGNMK